MALRKFMSLTIVLVILPIILEARYHGYDSYKQYYNNHINDGRWRESASKEVVEKSYNDSNNMKKGVKSRFAGDNKYANLESNFVFPDDIVRARNSDGNYAEIGRVKECGGKTFCEDVPNYPEEFVNQAIAKNHSLLHYAREDVVINVITRVDNDEETLCLSEERVVFPKSAINSKDKWLYILQSNQSNFHQGIRIETCREEGHKCRIVDGFAEGYVTSCNQKFIFYELSAISDDGEIIRDHFRFPASCCCHVRFDIDNISGKYN